MLKVVFVNLLTHTLSEPAQSTYIYRAPQFMSLRWNWDSPSPLAASECALPPVPKGGGAHSPAAKGVGESQFQRLEKRLALCLLCVSPYLYINVRSSGINSKESMPAHEVWRGAGMSNKVVVPARQAGN
jgi:hypothetical protein